MLDFFSSSLFSNLLAIFGIIISLLPQKDSISIDNSTNYFFVPSKKNNSTEDSYFLIFVGLIVLLATYILYALLKPYFTTILIIIYIATIIRYRHLGIPNRTQMAVPTLLIALSALLPFFSPTEVTTFWDNAYKIDFNNIDVLSKVIDQLKNPFTELKNLLITVPTNPLSVAILANLFFILAVFYLIFYDLVKPKRSIKVVKLRDVIVTIVFFSIIISFIFFNNPDSPARIAIDKFNYFRSN